MKCLIKKEPTLDAFSEIFFERNHERYFLTSEEVKKITYKKHWLYLGYTVKIPTCKINVELLRKDDTFYLQLMKIKNQRISCVKNIDTIKNKISEIEKNNKEI
jgi:hypothetical protein